MHDKIKELARKKGETVAEMLRKTGIKESTYYSMVERGGRVSLETASKIADYYGISLDEFRHD